MHQFHHRMFDIPIKEPANKAKTDKTSLKPEGKADLQK